MFIVAFLTGAVQATSHACGTLSKAVSFFFMGDPTSHTANQQHTPFSVVKVVKKTIRSWGKSLKELFLGKVKAQPFEKTIKSQQLLKVDYSFCAAENNNDIVRAVTQLHIIYAQVACLFRAGFMPIDSPDPSRLRLVTSGEKIRSKHQSPAEKECSQFYSSNVHNEILQISTTINNLSVKVVLNSNIDTNKLGISAPLSLFKNPYDIYDCEDYNGQAESILTRLSVVLAKMHASRGVDVSHLASRPDILSELISSFKNILKLDENIHYNMTYRNYLSSLQIKPTEALESSDSLYQWSLYILTKYRDLELFGDNGEDVIESSNIRPMNTEKIIQAAVDRKKQEFLNDMGAQMREGHEEFLNIGTGIPKRPVVMFKANINTDFASNISMPATIHADNKIVCVKHGKFYNDRMVHPFFRVLAKSTVDAKINVGPSKTVVAHLAYGPKPPIDYRLINNKIPNVKSSTSEMYSMYNSGKRVTDYNRAVAKEHYALTSGNMWAMLDTYKRLDADINLSQLHGEAIIGDLWKFKNFYGLALHTGRYRFNSEEEYNPSAERAWINRSYTKFLFSSRETDYRYDCASKILMNHQSLIDTLNYTDKGDGIRLTTGVVDPGPALSEIAFGILGFEYHFFLLELKKGDTFPTRGADFEYFAFLQEFALYFLDKQFRKEFSDMGENPDNALQILKDKVISSNLETKARRIQEMIDSEKTNLQELKKKEASIHLRSKDQETLFILNKFIQTTPTKSTITVSDLQDYFYNQKGYQFASSISLRCKLENLLSQRSCELIKDILEEELEGYEYAIRTLSEVNRLKRPEGLGIYFSRQHTADEEYKKRISDSLIADLEQQKAQNAMTLEQQKAQNAMTTREHGDSVGRGPFPQIEERGKLAQLCLQAEAYRSFHWYVLDVMLEMVPPRFQNQVFISTLGLVEKMVDAPNSGLSPLSASLYCRYKPQSRSIEELKEYLISQSNDLEFTMDLESEEVDLIEHF